MRLPLTCMENALHAEEAARGPAEVVHYLQPVGFTLALSHLNAFSST